MALGAIRGDKFKKMVMKATGTKGYLSSSVQSSLKQAQAQKYLKSGTQVSRQQATKIIHKLKQEGLAHKMDADATKYVKREFAKEAQRQENIKKQNIADRNKEIAAEASGAATAAKPAGDKKTSANKAQSAPIQSAGTLPSDSSARADGFVGSSFGSTNVKPANKIPAAAKPEEWPKEWKEAEKNLDDLAID